MSLCFSIFFTVPRDCVSAAGEDKDDEEEDDDEEEEEEEDIFHLYGQ